MRNAPWPPPPADAPLPPAPEPGKPRKPTLRRYTWSRLHADLPTKDEWTLVADMAKSDRARVEALVWRLDGYASTNQPRGSVIGFPLRALAATWRCDPDELGRIMVALEDPDVGWIEDDVIVTFWERNPDQEDPTGALRAQRSRARRKIIKAMKAKGAKAPEILAELEWRGLGYPQVTTVTRDTVTVTTRSNQIIEGRGETKISAAQPGEAPQAVQRDSGESGDNTIEPVLWLATEGKRIVVQRLNETPARAMQRIERWQEKIGGDLAALAAILEQVDATDMVVAHFLTTVVTAIDRHRLQTKGPLLPLGPALASTTKKANHG